jgi:UDP-N-acetylmuramate dehydrogenase
MTAPNPASILDESAKVALSEAIGEDGEIRWDEPMARHTTLRIGGPVDAWVMPTSYDALQRMRAAMYARGIVTRGFGSGSNLLVRDGGIRGVAINLRHISRVARLDAGAPGANDTSGGRAPDDANVWVEAGAATGRVLAFATIEQLGGVEFLGGVPGTVGGGLIMNAGTYLGEWKDVTTRVFSIDERGQTIVREAAECGFAYRTSSLPPEEIVTHARLLLPHRPRAEIEQAVRALRDRRKEREPHAVANAGSIFKNPAGDYAGRLIEACGLKGRRVGAAEVSPVHANWLVNTGGASAADLLALADLCRREVAAKFSVELALEVKVVGEER